MPGRLEARGALSGAVDLLAAGVRRAEASDLPAVPAAKAWRAGASDLPVVLAVWAR
ncbi:hypothetical protein [Lentzea californiensis]|uniref:hypothetical protein n=1 Tax=Lentzea californiensis TaxID=438851 RepID=UPI002165D1A5|nr:hypothetical protein [Lentzea californiensis]